MARDPRAFPSRRLAAEPGRWRSPALWTALALTAALVHPARAQTVSAGCKEPLRPGVIASASPEGVFTLASGDRITLADIRIAGETRLTSDRLARETQPAGESLRAFPAWLHSLASEPVLVAAGDPDRWELRHGRLALRSPEGSGRPGLDLAELLVGEGFALVDSGEADVLCRPALLAFEAQARLTRRGLWAGADARVVEARDTAALVTRVGRFTLVEGGVVSVGERASRTYINFGRFGSGAFTLTIPKRSWAALRRRGVTAEALRGRRVRARGTIEMWRAPVMEIVAPDMLEIIDGTADVR